LVRLTVGDDPLLWVDFEAPQPAIKNAALITYTILLKDIYFKNNCAKITN
jgi:hypothetical protein